MERIRYGPSGFYWLSFSVFKVVYFGGTLCSMTSANDWSKQIRRRSRSGRPHSVVLWSSHTKPMIRSTAPVALKLEEGYDRVDVVVSPRPWWWFANDDFTLPISLDSTEGNTGWVGARGIQKPCAKKARVILSFRKSIRRMNWWCWES